MLIIIQGKTVKQPYKNDQKFLPTAIPKQWFSTDRKTQLTLVHLRQTND